MTSKSSTEANLRDHTVFSTPYEEVKLTNMRRTIARRMSEAKQVPHFYLTSEVVLDQMLQMRADLNSSLVDHGIRISLNDMFIKALAFSLEAHPQCNVTFANDRLLLYKRVDIGVAVSVQNGLITPIMADAARKPVSRISMEMKELAELARLGKLRPHQYRGGTVTLSNMGMFGIKQFGAIINPPHSMIMAIGAAERRSYSVNGGDAGASVISATGSFDHRAMDGTDGGALMQTFRDVIENPSKLEW